MIFKKSNVGLSVKLFTVLLIFLVGFAFTPAQQQTKEKKQTAKPAKDIKVYPDEYSELDEVPVTKTSKDQTVAKTLERSRQKYLQALMLIEKGDTINAARFFEHAIEILNKLASYPNIDQNEDYADLAQSIIEDYETFVKSIDDLGENSSIFILRDKIFQAVDAAASSHKPNISTLNGGKKGDTKANNTPKLDLPPKVTIPLDDNELVQQNIEFLTNGKVRKYYTHWLERSGKWFSMMKKIAKEENMPQEIIYLSMIESGLDPNAVSKAKAVGLWQFMRATGEMYGLNKNSSVWIDERRDPEKSTRAAMRLLRDLYNEFGDWHLALAAYNRGTAGVRRSLAKVKTEDDSTKISFWDVRKYLPKETRNYVPLYIAATKIFLNQSVFGFKDLKYDEEYKYDTFKLSEPVSLKALAKAALISPEQFSKLNPELISNFTPPDVSEYVVKIPYGKHNEFSKNYAALTPEEKQPWIDYKVTKKETIASIARKYNVSQEALMSANNIENPSKKISAGTILKIPVDKHELSEYAEKIEKENTDNKAPEQDKPLISKKKTPEANKKTKGTTEVLTHHVVEKGETLFSIAKKFGIRPTDLRNANNIPFDQDKIEIGKNLTIPAIKGDEDLADNDENSEDISSAPISRKKGFSAPKESKRESKEISRKEKDKDSDNDKIIKHKVKKNETLGQIADDYDVTVQSLKKLNGLKKNKLKPGLVIKVKTSAVKNKKSSKDEERNIAKTSRRKTIHKVEKGESLNSIAGLYNVSEDQLKDWNKDVIKGNKIIKGSKLKIYDENPQKGSSSSSKKDKSKKQQSPKSYTIKKGDNLGKIADKYGISIEDLKKKNKKLKESSLQIGQKIKL